MEMQKLKLSPVFFYLNGSQCDSLRVPLKLDFKFVLLHYNCVVILNRWVFFQLTEIGLTGQSGRCVLKFVMAENKQDTGSAITQLLFTVVKTAKAIREIQELVTFLSVQVRP